MPNRSASVSCEGFLLLEQRTARGDPFLVRDHRMIGREIVVVRHDDAPRSRGAAGLARSRRASPQGPDLEARRSHECLPRSPRRASCRSSSSRGVWGNARRQSLSIPDRASRPAQVDRGRPTRSRPTSGADSACARRRDWCRAHPHLRANRLFEITNRRNTGCATERVLQLVQQAQSFRGRPRRPAMTRSMNRLPRRCWPRRTRSGDVFLRALMPGRSAGIIGSRRRDVKKASAAPHHVRAHPARWTLEPGNRPAGPIMSGRADHRTVQAADRSAPEW